MKYDNSKTISIDNTDIQYIKSMEFLAKLIEYVDDIDQILKDVANHYEADRAYIFEFSEDGKTLDNTYEYCKEGVAPEIDSLKNIPYESVAAWVTEFERVGAFFISSLDKDVEANSLTYEILEPQGIESLIAAPIYREDRIIGFIGVDNPRINTNDIVILKTTASILYSELSRKIVKKNQTIQEMAKAQQKQSAVLGEIREIVASANMGIWRIELIDNEEPRMYVDDTMKALLGIDGEDHSPEKIYLDWFSNITEEALPSVLNSVNLMKKGYFDENTYLWNHPIKGVRYVRCGGTSKIVRGGFYLQGYHYDVDEVVRKNISQMHMLEKAIDDKKGYYETLESLGDIFYSLHVINLKYDTVSAINAKNEVKEIVNHTNGAVKMMQEVINRVTSDEYLEKALEFTDLSTLSDRMINKQVLSCELFGKNIGWYLASFISMEKDDCGRPIKVIFATRIIDEEKKQKEKLIHKTQTDEMTGLLNRRAYEENIYEHNDVPDEDKFIYVSLDANGLKVVNDTKGHAAGDELLIGVSQCMKKCLGAYGNLYRTGGDEFVAILYVDDSMIKDILDDFERTVFNWKGKLIDEISVSFGWINKYEMPSASTRELASVAEKRMYEAKSEYYSKQGVDRRGQQDAHKILCALYTKILKINITNDTYKIVNMDSSEQSVEKGFADKISEWLVSFGRTGQVHPDDLSEYLQLTDINYIRDYFLDNKTSLQIFYRRRYDDGFKKVMMEIVPANDFSKDDMNLFLYVKNIDL